MSKRKKGGEQRNRGGTEREGRDRASPLCQLGLHAAFVASSPLIRLVRKPGHQSPGMGDPATLVESATPPVATAIPTVIAGEVQGEDSLGSEQRRTNVCGGHRWAWPFVCLGEVSSNSNDWLCISFLGWFSPQCINYDHTILCYSLQLKICTRIVVFIDS